MALWAAYSKLVNKRKHTPSILLSTPRSPTDTHYSGPELALNRKDRQAIDRRDRQNRRQKVKTERADQKADKDDYKKPNRKIWGQTDRKDRQEI